MGFSKLTFVRFFHSPHPFHIYVPLRRMQKSPEIAIPQAVHTLPVMETFYSVQGEGHHTGKAAFFIRLAGCDVGCSWCDVKESWEADRHPHIKISHLASQAKESGAEIVVVTGGEPTLYNLEELTSELRALGLQTHLETSGTNPVTGEWHWICFSPKKFKPPVPEIYQQADELKVVVFNKHDLQWAAGHGELVTPACKLFLQPEWSKREQVAGMIAEYVMEHVRWRISLQTHKYLNLP